MQRLIAIFGIAIVLTPNTSTGAELGNRNHNQNFGPYATNFDGSYVDEPEKTSANRISKNTEKIMTYMARVGLDSSNVKSVASYMNSHIEDNRFNIAGGKYGGFNLTLSHDVAVPEPKKFQLKLQNEDMPHWNMIGSTRGVMINYKYEW